MKRSMLPLALALVAGLTVQPAVSAETVPIRAGIHDGYARLVFDWAEPVDYEARLDGERLVVSFARPADFDPAGIGATLQRYLGPAEFAEEGTRIVFPTRQPLALKHFALGPKVVVDLEETAPVDAEAAPRVAVRAGEHDGFSRLAVDWTTPVGAELSQDGQAVTLRFDRAASFDLGNYRQRAPAMIGDLNVSSGEGGSSIAFTVPKDARARLWRDGHKVVVDVEPVPEARMDTPSEVSNEAEAVGGEHEEAPSPRREDSPEPAIPRAAAGPSESSSEAEPAGEAAPLSLLPDEDSLRSEVATPGAAEGDSPGDQTDGVPREGGPAGPTAGSRAPEPPSASAPARDDSGEEARARPAAAVVGAGEAPPQPPRIEAAIAPRLEVTRLARDPEAEVGKPVQGKAAEPQAPVVLEFEWQQMPRAAAFRRGELVWLVFDALPPRDAARAIVETAPELGPVHDLSASRTTVLGLSVAPGIEPRVSSQNGRWRVDLRMRAEPPPDPLVPDAIRGPEGQRLRFETTAAGDIVWLADPLFGDRLAVVPLATAGTAVPRDFVYPQVRALETAQGIAIQPLTDGIEVAAGGFGVLVRHAGGLLLSDSASAAAESGPDAAGARESSRRLFDLPAWRRGPPARYTANRQALMREAALGEGSEQALAYLDLLRFYFAHGFASEALGLFEILGERRPRLLEEPELRLIKGASELLVEDYAAAGRSLDHPSLAAEREAALWQAALAAAAHDWPTAATGFAETKDLIAEYAPPVRRRLSAMLLESQIESGDLAGARETLAGLRVTDWNSFERARIDYLRGRLALLDGREDQAEDIWREVAGSRHRPSSAKARLGLLERALARGETTTAEAIETLERLRFAWRGDRFEYALLDRLDDLYVDQLDYRSALLALKDAAARFPDSPQGRRATAAMSAHFAELFLSERGEQVPPLRALGIYREFRELTPIGEAGDRMIARLADRLVEVDLLDQAAELLDGQVRFRLGGEDKARAGARLALIHLLDRDYGQALAALELGEGAGLPEALSDHRRHLKARAMAGLERPDEALELLVGDESEDALRLRADILWNERRWPEAALALARLLPARPPANRELSGLERKGIANLAIALTLAGDRTALRELADAFGTVMSEGPHAELFRVMALDPFAPEAASIAESFGRIDRLESFVSSYRGGPPEAAENEMN